MTYGLRIRNPEGNTLVLTPDRRLGLVLGSLNDIALSGSVVNAGFSRGTLWYRIGAVLATSPSNAYPNPALLANVTESRAVTVSGNTLSWAITLPSRVSPSTIRLSLVYGTY